MELVLKAVVKILPLLFGIGFLAPVIAAGLHASEITPPLGLAPLAFGLIVGGAWGFFATITGRWL